jgi:hypothetical protein
MADKRGERRVRWKNRVTISDLNSNKIVSNDARIENLSRSGFRVYSDEPLRRGAHCRFKLQLDAIHAPVTVIGKVVHVRVENIFHSAGVKIDSIPFFARSRFNRFLVSQAPSLRTRFVVYSTLIGGAAYLIGAQMFNLPLAGSIAAGVLTTLLLSAWMPY